MELTQKEQKMLQCILSTDVKFSKGRRLALNLGVFGAAVGVVLIVVNQWNNTKELTKTIGFSCVFFAYLLTMYSYLRFRVEAFSLIKKLKSSSEPGAAPNDRCS